MKNIFKFIKKEGKETIKFFKGEIDFEDKNERMFGSLRELVAMLFAVLVGVGLDRIKDVWGDPYAFSLLILAYIAILLSWWGYNFGITVGPPETNAWNYVIDCVLLVVYWFLINSSSDLMKILVLFLAMFSLYSLWELLRWRRQKKVHADPLKIRNALITNLLFSLLLGLLLIRYIFMVDVNFWRWFYILILFIILFLYRYVIYRVYTHKNHVSVHQINLDKLEKVLLEKAKSAAQKAKANLSNFKVGAAILADSGEMYVGCNIEFDNYSNTIHAEEGAISAFIAAGEKKMICVAIFSASESVAFPCGMCRQSLFELGGEQLKIISSNKTTLKVKTMAELLPNGFSLEKS